MTLVAAIALVVGILAFLAAMRVMWVSPSREEVDQQINDALIRWKRNDMSERWQQTHQKESR